MSETGQDTFQDYYFTPGAVADRPYQVCHHCVMDTSDPAIQFTSTGCNHCDHARDRLRRLSAANASRPTLNDLRDLLVGRRGKSKYDCIIGLSGGVDSSYVAYVLKKELGLNPLAVHLDNGWDSELAVKNIEQLIRTLGIDYTAHVVNWPEFRDLQRAYFDADVVDIEALTDHAITASLFRLARKISCPSIVLGTNSATEGILPLSWIHRKTDVRNIKDIHGRFGSVALKTYPFMSTLQFYAFRAVGQPDWYSLLDRIDFDKEAALRTLESAVGYRRYPYKHYESIFTRFYQAYILPRKFGFDKRRAHLSSLICSGQLERTDAHVELQKPLYTADRLAEDYSYVMKKLGYSRAEFEAYLARAPKPHEAYKTDKALFDAMRGMKRIAPRRMVTRLAGIST